MIFSYLLFDIILKILNLCKFIIIYRIIYYKMIFFINKLKNNKFNFLFLKNKIELY